MFPIINIGPVALQTPGLIFLLGVWLGLSLAERLASRFQTEAGHLYNIVFYSLMAGIIGARISFIIRNIEAFRGNLLNLISLNPGLFDPIGGILAGILIGVIYAQRKKLKLWNTLDGITPVLSVMGLAFGLSHLASGNAFGAETNLPWGIELWGAVRHPTQIYESILAVIILSIIWRRGTPQELKVPGETFFIFLALSAGARLFLEAFRGDSVLLSNGMRSVQIVAWLLLAASLWGLRQFNKMKFQAKIATENGN